MNNDFKNQIFEKIRKKEVFMYPKTYFIARLAIIIIVSLLAFMLLVYSLSFVFFSINESGKQFLLGFGVRGILTFLGLFPWGIIIFTGLLFFLLEWALHSFKFSYRLPIMRIFSYTLALTLLAGILLTFTPIHLTFLKKAEMNELPIIGRIYDTINDSHVSQGIVRGDITSIGGNSFVISRNDKDKDEDDGTWNIFVPSGFNISELYVGEKIYAAGTITGNNIYAYGIHEFTSREQK